MKCNKKYGKLGSGIPYVECNGELTFTRFYDNTQSVLFSKSMCNECNHTHTGIVWQR